MRQRLVSLLINWIKTLSLSVTLQECANKLNVVEISNDITISHRQPIGGIAMIIRHSEFKVGTSPIERCFIDLDRHGDLVFISKTGAQAPPMVDTPKAVDR